MKNSGIIIKRGRRRRRKVKDRGRHFGKENG
jgi:hypothetical protein